MMIPAGIEALNVYGGAARLNVLELSAHRGLDTQRFDKLLMREKTVALPFEDPVTFAVNAAKPLVDALPPEQRARIEMVVTCTESGIDFGKSLSTYIHHYLGLSRNCRLFEIKQACYSGTAGLQMAVNFVRSGTSPGGKALVVCTDLSRFALADADAIQEWSYSEPSSGAGAVAMLISEQPHILNLDAGAYGNYGFEVMDTCRPGPDTEAGDADLSLLTYLECCDAAYTNYLERVNGADFRTSFQYLCFHTPFGGMVKGAHRHMMRRQCKAKPDEIEADFARRVLPSLIFGQRMGNIAGGSVFLGLAGLLHSTDLTAPCRIGLFSYGSGCCSEFFSGVIGPNSHGIVRASDISGHLDRRHALSIAEYENLLRGTQVIRFGQKDATITPDAIPAAWAAYQGQGRLALEGMAGYHRKYRFV